MRSHLLSITVALAVALPACAQNNGFTFDAPGGWKTVYAGGNTHLISNEGARYMVLWSSHIDAAPNVLKSAAVKNVAQQLATPMLKSMTFLGAQSVKVEGGSGAFFRFEGQPVVGSASHVIVPVWIAVSDGGQGIAVVPEGAAPPDQSVELTEMFRSLRFTHSAPRTASGRRHVTTRTVRVVPVVELERYEGRLYRDDRQFALSLHADGTASAEWKRPNRKPQVLLGNWSGNDGNYTVRLNGGNTSPLVLQLERDGPRETGSMIVSGKREPIVALNMVSVPVKGTSAMMYGVMFR